VGDSRSRASLDGGDEPAAPQRTPRASAGSRARAGGRRAKPVDDFSVDEL
jgi:hypothetical protein